MKTLTASLLFCTALAGAPVLAQTAKPAAKPTVKATTTTKKVTTPSRPAAKPATAARPAATSRPAAKPTATNRPAPAPKAAAVSPALAPEPASKPAAAATATGLGGELFRKGTIMANLGVGLGLGYGYGFGGSLKSTPAMSLSVERGCIEGVGPGVIGIGGMVGYKSYHYNYGTGNYKSTWTNVLVSVRGTYHYNILENPKLDTYGGVSIGVRVQKWKDTFFDSQPYMQGYASSSSYVTSGIFVGARYFLTDNIGAFTELGYDMNYLKIGLTAKF